MRLMQTQVQPPRLGRVTWRGRALKAAALALAAYAGAVALLWWGQERLLFHPVTLPADHRFELPADVREATVEVPGARLHALHLQLPRPDGVVFFLHGNAGNLQTWFVNADFYRRANFDLYMLDYRGFGRSSGSIESQPQLEADIRAAWAGVAPLYAGKKRVIYGRSIGTGLAAMLAAEVQPELTVLVSPYSSMAMLVRERYPWLPGAVLRYPLHTDTALTRVRGRVLLVHGERDTLIPPAHSAALRRVAPQSELLLLPDAGHNDIQHQPVYVDGLAAALVR